MRIAAHLRTGRETDQHIADLGNTGIGQEPFHVLLGDGHDVAVGHRQDRCCDQQQGPDWSKCRQGDEEHSQEDGKGRSLRGDREKCRHRRRRAMIGVRNPRVKRHRTNFESQCGENQQEANGQSRGGLRGLHIGKHQFACFPIDQADAIGEESGSEDAQDEKFDTRFIRAHVLAEIGHENIETESGKFQRDEDRQQVVRGSHEHHSQCRHDDEEIIFSAEELESMNVIDGGENDEDRRSDDEHFEEEGHPVEGKHVREQGSGDTGDIEPDQAAKGGDEPRDAEIGQLFVGQPGEGEINNQDKAEPDT